MNTPIKSYAQIVSENIQLKEEKRSLINQIVKEKFEHSIALEALKKLMNDKCEWYEEQLKKTEKITADAVAALEQTEKVIKMLESQ